MHTRFEIKATGGELFKQLIGGALLTSITFGVYFPWYAVSLVRFVASRTKIHAGGRVIDLEYRATGFELFKEMLLGGLLVSVTLGIYFPWWVAKLYATNLKRLTLSGRDGVSFRLRSSLAGPELFKTMLVGWLLSSITFGVYGPWLACRMLKLVAERTEIHRDEERLGSFRCTGEGGELFVAMLKGYLLSVITLGIYAFWFQVELLTFVANRTRVTIDGVTYAADFAGKGGENLKVHLVGYALTTLTFGVYGFWYAVSVLEFLLHNLRVLPSDALGAAGRREAPASPAPLPRVAESGGASDGRALWARAFLPPLSSAPPPVLPEIAAEIEHALLDRELVGIPERTVRQPTLVPLDDLRDVWEHAATEGEVPRAPARAASYA